MSARRLKPWWDRINEYQLFDERKEFMQGVMGFRPSNRQEAMMAQIIAGYVRSEFAQPKSLGKKK